MQRSLPDDDSDARYKKILEHFEHVDETVLVVLKGHLLIEEALAAIIEGFVFHPEFMQAASLRFGHKVSVARSMSLSDQQNEMWSIILALTNWWRNTRPSPAPCGQMRPRIT